MELGYRTGSVWKRAQAVVTGGYVLSHGILKLEKLGLRRITPDGEASEPTEVRGLQVIDSVSRSFDTVPWKPTAKAGALYQNQVFS